MGPFDAGCHGVDEFQLCSHGAFLPLIDRLAGVAAAVAEGVGLADADVLLLGIFVQSFASRGGDYFHDIGIGNAQLGTGPVLVGVSLAVYQGVVFEVVSAVVVEGQQTVKGVVDEFLPAPATQVLFVGHGVDPQARSALGVL